MKKHIICIFLASIFIMGTLNVKGNFNITIKVLVSRADNGLPIPGAEFKTLGTNNDKKYRTNQKGEVLINSTTHDHCKCIAILYCIANGYYPATQYRGCYGTEVASTSISKHSPSQIINILLEPVRRSDPPLPGPVLLEPIDNTNKRVGGEILFKWETIFQATGYEIQWSQNSGFSNPKAYYTPINSTTFEYQQHKTKMQFHRGTVYWRVRAFDGVKWGEYSVTRKILLN